MRMKNLACAIFLILLSPSLALADKGTVVKADVCGVGNVIIETTDGWYVAAEHYSGILLTVGENVFGDLKTYGFEDITRQDGDTGNFYIEDFESDIGEAYGELCD